MLIKSLRISAVGDLPLTLAETKLHLRVFHDDEDDSIAGMIAAGVDHFERRTGRAFSELTCTFQLSEFPAGDDPIVLPRPPAFLIEGITYSFLGSITTLDPSLYAFDSVSAPALLLPALGHSWPDCDRRAGAVSISFTAGDIAQVPPSIKQALLVWLDLEFHNHSDATAARMRARVDSVLQNFTLRHPGLEGVTV